MKDIVSQVKQFVREDFNLTLYLYCFFFLVITIFLNYKFNFENGILDKHFETPISLLYYTLFYAFAYYSISIPQLWIQGKKSILKTSDYWIRSLFFLTILGFSAFFYFHRGLDYSGYSWREKYFIIKIIGQLKPFLTVLVPLVIFWRLYDIEVNHFYGLKIKGTNLKPYLIMLFLMFPLIFGASFLEDFQHTYPILKPWVMNNAFDWEEWKYSAVFEPLYGFSFISVELIFRGAFVIGMSRLLGKEAILPMVVTYAFLHFGKPIGETIGSILGGYILGVIALRKEHILGGCIIHIGVAYLMELTALWQHYLN